MGRRVRVLVKGFGVIEAEEGENLGFVLARAGVMPLPCGGRGFCGKCLVRVRGSVTPPTGNEILHGVVEQGLRLACQVRLLGDVEVEPLLKTVPRVSLASIEVPLRAVERVFRVVDPEKAVALPEPVYVHALSCGASRRFVELEGIGIAGSLPMGCGDDEVRVLLVDLGTTKIGWWAVDLSGGIVEEGAVHNPQMAYGADVISRLSRALEDPQAFRDMRASLRRAVEDVARRYRCTALCVAAGNSAITSLFVGAPLKSLAMKPYSPAFLGPFIDHLQGCTPCLVAPLIRGFVGGDALADLVAVEGMEPPTPYLVVDLGTNTELILVKSREPPEVFVASTPAGPAFEGHLTSGSSAVTGGVFRVRLRGFAEDGTPRFDIYGEPAGFTGSGVVSLVAELVRHRMLDRRGRLVKGFIREGGVKKVVVHRGSGRPLVFTQLDVREFQKAMAAVKAGWRMLLSRAGVEVDELRRVFVAGSFGSSIDPEDALLLHLVPPVERSKVVVGGNLVLPGLRLMVFSRGAYRKAMLWSRLARHVDLAREEGFADLWIESLEFESAAP